MAEKRIKVETYVHVMPPSPDRCYAFLEARGFHRIGRTFCSNSPRIVYCREEMQGDIYTPTVVFIPVAGFERDEYALYEMLKTLSVKFDMAPHIILEKIEQS